MSLAVLADHMASRGRGPDSMLIHMSPREVQGLQALAENHGGSLTINPETGLPEAGFLDKLLPAIIGFALAPLTAGTSLAFLGATPMASALTVGGLQTLRTGDIGKGISAGLGAYGGAGLSASLAGAGGNILSGEATALAAEQAGNLAAEQASQLGVSDAIKEQMIDEASQATARVATDASPFERISAGAKSAVSSPSTMGQFAKDNFKNIAYAAGPILAGADVQSKLPQTVTKPGMIRPYNYFGGQYVAGNPYEAAPTRSANGGLMGLADGGMTNYDDAGMSTGGMSGMFDFAQRSEPVVRMSRGGIVALAAGGETPAYFLANPDVAKAFNENAGGYATGLNAQQYADLHYATHGANEIAAGTRALAPSVDLAASAAGITPTSAMAALVANPNMRPEEFDVAASQYNLNNYNAASPPIHGYQVANDKTAAAQQYLKDNPDVQAYINSQAGKDYLAANPQFDASDIAFTHFQRYGEKEGRKFGVDTVKPPVVTPPVTYNTAGTNAPGGLESILGLPPGVSGAGITTVNPNGTITTRPDIPGIEGGFTGTTDVRDTYEAGGGSLGVNKYLFAPTTTKQIEDRYKLTGGSKQAMDYLTGKTKYSPVPYTEDGQISKSYAESVMKLPKASSDKMYIFSGGKFISNPDYAIPTRNKEGVLSRNVTNQNVIDYVKSPEYSNDDTFLSWMTSNNLLPEQIATATGMSVAEIYKKIKKAKPVDKPADVVTGQNDGGGGDGGDANGGLMKMAQGGMSHLGDYSDGGRLLRGPGDGVSDSIPATIGNKRPARLADGEFVVPARIVSELGNGSTEAGARKLYAMMDRVQSARRGTVGKGRVAKNSRSDKYLPA